MITPLLEYKGINLGNDAVGQCFIDGPYLRSATYISGRYRGNYVFYYYLKGKPVEVPLPNRELASLERAGIISFNIANEDFLGPHGSLYPVVVSRMRSVPTRPDPSQDDDSNPIYGPPRYQFEQYKGTIPPGALQAHEHKGKLQRWNKAHDRTIFKIKTSARSLEKL